MPTNHLSPLKTRMWAELPTSDADTRRALVEAMHTVDRLTNEINYLRECINALAQATNTTMPPECGE